MKERHLKMTDNQAKKINWIYVWLVARTCLAGFHLLCDSTRVVRPWVTCTYMFENGLPPFWNSKICLRKRVHVLFWEILIHNYTHFKEQLLSI